MTEFIHHIPALIITVPLLFGFATPLIRRVSRRGMHAWVVAVLAFTEALAIAQIYLVLTQGTQVYVMGGASYKLTMPPDSGGIPVRIILTVDAFSAFMAFTAATVTLAGGIYSLSSEKETSGEGMYYTLLLLMLSGMLGMVMTGDLFNFFVFLEINSLASAGLIAYRVGKGISVEAAFKYAIVSSIGALIYLLGVGILYGEYDALNLAMIASRMQFTGLDKVVMALFTVGLAMKAGSVPLHYWVPDAYGKAPEGISALLVVASQASLYALFRICFSLFGLGSNTLTTGWFLISLGLLSIFMGVTMALIQTDIKRLIAYCAVSQTGYMLLSVGVGLATLGNATFNRYGLQALEGGIFHVINSAMYEGLLFLTAGALVYRLGTSDLNRMGGLAHNMKYTTMYFMIGALSIAGIPPFNGFASKLMIYESTYLFNPILAIIAIIGSILTLAYFVKVFHSAFMGPRLYEVKEAPKLMLIGMAILTSLIILFGLFPNIAIQYLVGPAAKALANQTSYISSVMGGV